MRHIFVRPVTKEDTEKFIEWSKNTANNLWDPDVPIYPSTTIRCAFNSSGPIVYAPIQRPLFLDALAINPSSSPMDIAAGLKAITQDAVSQAFTVGAGEVYFLCRDESTSEFAERHAYKKMPWNVYRIKLNELQDKKPEGSE